MPIARPIEVRFWEKVQKTNGCWNWTGSKRTKNGYGGVRHHNKILLAHRVAYVLTYGPIRDEVCVLHHCDNPMCVRPYHLWLGSKKDNAQDMLQKGRGNKATGKRSGRRTHPGMFRGEGNPNSKLHTKQVQKIRRLCVSGTNQYVVAAMFHVSQSTVSKIVLGRTWR